MYWAEQGLLLQTEFRDGNVPAGYEQLRVLKRALELLPEGVEVCFVPNWIGHSKRGPASWYLAIREPLRQLELPGGVGQRELPFPSLEMNRQNYKLFGIVTNMDGEGGQLVAWQHQRCGKSEEAHQVIQEDLAGGKLPSGDFAENAAWWWVRVLALNLNVVMKRLVLGTSWQGKRMKAIRFGLIHLPGRVLDRCRQLIVRLGKPCSAYPLLIEARQKMAQWAPRPSG